MYHWAIMWTEFRAKHSSSLGTDIFRVYILLSSLDNACSVLFKKLVPRLIISDFSPSMGCSEKPDLGSAIDGLPHFSRVHIVYIIHFN